MKILAWLEERGQTQPYRVPASARVVDALNLMREKNIGLVVVGDIHKSDVGVYSERDYARNGEIAGHSAFVSILDVMTPREKFIWVTPKASLRHCAEVFEGFESRPRHLLVMDKAPEEGGKVLAVVSQRDLIAALWGDLAKMRFHHFGQPT